MATLIPQGGVFEGLDRLNQALDIRQQNAMAQAQMQENMRRNALAEEYAAQERNMKMQEIQRQELIRNAMSQPYTQQQGGPLMSQMGQDYQPVSLQTMQPTRELASQRLQGLGEWEKSLALMPETSQQQDEYQIINGQYVPKRPGASAMPIPGFKQETDQPQFDIQQDADGNLFYIPKQPGSKPIPVGMKGKMPKDRPGMQIEFDPATGTFRMSEGIAAPLSRGTAAKTEQDIIDTNDALQRLSQIESSFKDEYLTVPFKAKQGVTAAYEKMGGELSPEKAKALGEYTDFRQKGMELLNEEIKRMTGAAITKQEEPRLRASMPDPQNDSPTEYKRKYDMTIQSLRLALARKNYVLQKGLSMGNVPLNDMAKVINKRGAELEAQIGNRIKDKAQAQQEVQKQLSREFGI